MTAEELIDFIRKGKNKGYSSEQLKKILIEKGWDVKTIDEAIAYFNKKDIYNFPREDIKKSISKKQRPLGITLLSILFFIGGGFEIFAGLGILSLGGTFLASLPLESKIFAGLFVFLGIGLLITGGLIVFIASGLWRLRNWARVVSIIILFLGIILSIIGIIYSLKMGIGGEGSSIINIFINAGIIYYLFKRTTKEAFGVV